MSGSDRVHFRPSVLSYTIGRCALMVVRENIRVSRQGYAYRPGNAMTPTSQKLNKFIALALASKFALTQPPVESHASIHPTGKGQTPTANTHPVHESQMRKTLLRRGRERFSDGRHHRYAQTAPPDQLP